MNLAHVVNGQIVAIYPEGRAPVSYKGKLLPVSESEQPKDKPGVAWRKHFEVFEDRVELRWLEETLSTEEQATAEDIAETARIRTIMEALRSGQGTAAERLARLERVVGHLCKLTLQA